MRYLIGDVPLELPEYPREKKRGSDRTAHQVVPWRDCAESCRLLDAVCACVVPPVSGPMRILDGIARAGFWGAVFRNRWKTCRLHLNEEDTACLDTLRLNFPDAVVTGYGLGTWKTPPEADLVLLDFDHFTLRILDTWKTVLSRFSRVCDNLIVADGACFGFRFGNLKRYGVNDARDYYYLLRDALDFTGLTVTAVSKFSNAAAVLLQRKKKRREIQFLEPTCLVTVRGAPKARLSLWE